MSQPWLRIRSSRPKVSAKKSWAKMHAADCVGNRATLQSWRLTQTPPGPVQLNPSPQAAIALPALVMQISP